MLVSCIYESIYTIFYNYDLMATKLHVSVHHTIFLFTYLFKNKNLSFNKFCDNLNKNLFCQSRDTREPMGVK